MAWLRNLGRALLPRRGTVLASVLLLGIVAVVGTATGGTTAGLQWLESSGFCGQCHTMQPEVQANKLSPHSDVACAECHVSRGVAGFVGSKVRGIEQLGRLVTGQYERPIPPPDYGQLNVIAENCRECHVSSSDKGPRLIVQRHFGQDERSTEQAQRVVLRQLGVASDGERGIHWHVQQPLYYLPRDETESAIDYIRVTEPSGQTREFASKSFSGLPPSVQKQTASEGLVRMDCLTCHNRVGHELVSPDRAIDDALSAGTLDKTLPFVKKQALGLLTVAYSSTREVMTRIAGLADFYRQRYPEVYEQQKAAIDNAVRVLQNLYLQRVANPEMGASYKHYPSFLGHQEGTLGCFRCHDGQHFLLNEDRPTGVKLKTSCSLCHTTPEAIGQPLTRMGESAGAGRPLPP